MVFEGFFGFRNVVKVCNFSIFHLFFFLIFLFFFSSLPSYLFLFDRFFFTIFIFFNFFSYFCLFCLHFPFCFYHFPTCPVKHKFLPSFFIVLGNFLLSFQAFTPFQKVFINFLCPKTLKI